MKPDAFHAAALALPGATFDVKWGADRTYCVGGKIFAFGGALEDPAPCAAPNSAWFNARKGQSCAYAAGSK